MVLPLQTLRLRGNSGFDTDGLVALAAGIRHGACKLEKLGLNVELEVQESKEMETLWNPNYTDPEVTVIAELQRGNPTLSKIALNGNSVGDDSVCVLGNVVGDAKLPLCEVSQHLSQRTFGFW